MGWMSGGDKHTGWKNAAGQALTDTEARAIVDKADRQHAAGKWKSGKK